MIISEPVITFFTLRLLSPELWVLFMSCFALLAGLFSTKLTYILAQFTLVGAAILTVCNFELTGSLFDGMYLQDQLAGVLKLFIYLAVGWVFLYARSVKSYPETFEDKLSGDRKTEFLRRCVSLKAE